MAITPRIRLNRAVTESLLQPFETVAGIQEREAQLPILRDRFRQEQLERDRERQRFDMATAKFGWEKDKRDRIFEHSQDLLAITNQKERLESEITFWNQEGEPGVANSFIKQHQLLYPETEEPKRKVVGSAPDGTPVFEEISPDGTVRRVNKGETYTDVIRPTVTRPSDEGVDKLTLREQDISDRAIMDDAQSSMKLIVSRNEKEVVRLQDKIQSPAPQGLSGKEKKVRKEQIQSDIIVAQSKFQWNQEKQRLIAGIGGWSTVEYDYFSQIAEKLGVSTGSPLLVRYYDKYLDKLKEGGADSPQNATTRAREAALEIILIKIGENAE
jgi:hypothetical protein